MLAVLVIPTWSLSIFFSCCSLDLYPVALWFNALLCHSPVWRASGSKRGRSVMACWRCCHSKVRFLKEMPVMASPGRLVCWALSLINTRIFTATSCQLPHHSSGSRHFQSFPVEWGWCRSYSVQRQSQILSQNSCWTGMRSSKLKSHAYFWFGFGLHTWVFSWLTIFPCVIIFLDSILSFL